MAAKTTSLRRRTPPATTQCRSCALRCRPEFDQISEDALAYIEASKETELSVRTGQAVFTEGNKGEYVYTVLSGWYSRFKVSPSGDRHIIDHALPGDMLGIDLLFGDSSTKSVEALTDGKLCAFPVERMRNAFKECPDVAFHLTQALQYQKSIADQALFSMGTRSPAERVANLILRLYSRAQVVGMATNDQIRLPFTQQHLAETVSLSQVHAQRTLRKLNEMALLTWNKGLVTIDDRPGLEALAHYTSGKSAHRFVL